MPYFVIKEAYDEGNVYVSDIPDGLVRKYQLLQGISRLAGWPPGLAAQFSKDRAEGMRLTDWVPTPFGWLLISGRFKAILEAMGAPNVEYLPIKMVNHKKRLASPDYWIVNFLVLIEAVDRSRSVFDVDAAEDDKIFSFDKLVLLDAVESKGPLIFRPKEAPRLVLVRSDLAERIQGDGLTGLKLTPTSQFRTYDPNDP